MHPEENKTWYYASASNERLGPVSIGELRTLASEGVISPTTLVWNPEHSGWIPSSEITHLLTAAKAAEVSPPAPAEEAPVIPPQEIKPHKSAFLFPRILKTAISSVIFGMFVALGCHLADESPWFGLLIFLAIFVLGLLSGLAGYRKERYLLQPSRLVCHRGGLFSDEATELEIRNITHVKLKLPWLRYKFFKIGDVIVETAGTTKPMVMRSIREPDTVYAEMRGRMKNNGYDLTQRVLIHQEKPALVGIIVDCLTQIVASAVLVLFFVGAGTGAREESGSTPIDPFLPGLAIAALVSVIIYVVLRFLDLRRRTYSVYNDVVVYEEGFLTRHNAFIPYENIADSNTKRTFTDQILGLFDVHVSCQGSGSEIKFRRLRGGENLSNAIDQLVTAANQKPKPARRASGEDPTTSRPQRPSRSEPELVPMGEIRMAEYRINGARLLIPQLLWLIFPPLWIVMMVKSLILMSSTRYFVRPDSLRHSYKFLSVDEREFSYDKITGVVIKRNLWDLMFGTMTLKFWSIGSGKSLEFAHIHCEQIDLPALMRQVGIPATSQEPVEKHASFGISAWLRARIWQVLGITAIAGVIAGIAVLEDEPLIYMFLSVPVLIAIIGMIHAILYYPRQRLRFHEHHIEAQQGIIAKNSYFVRYKNVKRVTSTRYPGGAEGDLKIYVAGEEQVAAEKRQIKGTTPMMKQCSFTTRMLPRADEAGTLLDDILSGRTHPTTAALPAEKAVVLVESKRSVGNALVSLLLISIVIFPLILLLPLTIPLTILRVKCWGYRIEDFRIVIRHGLIYRSVTSVLLDRVDSLKQNQGMLNKVFRNGKVSIMTAGSSKPDLVLPDSPDYLKLYEEIRLGSQ